MSFNKHFPHRVEPPRKGLSATDRALFMRMATWISLLMLITGYVILWAYWD